MRKYIRPALSIATIGLFLLFAMASFGPDGSTNTTVAIKDCEVKPPVSVTLKIEVGLLSFDNFPIEGAEGVLFISHQKVNANDECTFAVDGQQQISFVTNSQGKFNYTGSTWVHDNSEDLIRVEIYLYPHPSEGFVGYKDVEVKKYSSGDVKFIKKVHKVL
jgi:hypothetical protein